jgi:hypothetical protein
MPCSDALYDSESSTPSVSGRCSRSRDEISNDLQGVFCAHGWPDPPALLSQEVLRGLRKGPFCRYLSPLPDSNRRPPPYHRAARREARASAGTRGHESPARRRKRPKTSDRAWTRAPALVFPHCSLAHRCASGASGSSITTRELRQEHGWTSLSVPEASDDRGPTKGRFDQVTATAPTPARWCLSEARRRPCRVGKAGRRQSSAPCRRRRGRPNGSSRARTRRGTSGSGR